MSAAPAAPPAAWADVDTRAGAGRLLSRIGTFCLVELQRLRHDRSELVTRAIQPVLWLLIFGTTFSRIRAIPTGGVPYLDYLAPGIMAQSALFIAIFYGIQIIWERDAGVLTKLLATPTPRVALVAGKAFASGVRAIAQAVVVLVVCRAARRRRSPPTRSSCSARSSPSCSAPRSSAACRSRWPAGCSSASG